MLSPEHYRQALPSALSHSEKPRGPIGDQTFNLEGLSTVQKILDKKGDV